MSLRSSQSPLERGPAPRVVVAGVFAVLLIIGTPTTASAVDISDATVAGQVASDAFALDDVVGSAIDTRRRLGFKDDPAYVEQLQGTNVDVGTDAIGLPLTASELAEVVRREEVLGVFFESVEAYVRTRPDFGGVYVDQLAGGVVVVLTTGDAEALAAELHEAEPRLAGDVRVRHVEATAAELEEASSRLVREQDGWSRGIPVFEAAVDYERTQVVIAVPEDQIDTAAGIAESALADTLDAMNAEGTNITVRVESGGIGIATVCTARDNCYSPLRPGIAITPQPNSGPRCTLGFHIVFNGGARNVLTAGHCSGTLRYHYAFGLVGVQSANLLCAGGLPYSDVKRMTVDPSQQTSGAYGSHANEIIHVTTSAWPVQNATVRVSLGVSNALRTGIVTFASVDYFLTGFSCSVHGARHNVANIGGDSGSPIWLTSPNRAIGIHSSAQGHFAKVQLALDMWNGSVYS